jgi:hypothetical protein
MPWPMGSEGTAPPFFTPGTRREWSISSPSSLTLEKEAPGTLWTGGWEGPTASLHAMAYKRKISCLCRKSNPRGSAPSHSPYRLNFQTKYCTIHIPYICNPNIIPKFTLHIYSIVTELNTSKETSSNILRHFTSCVQLQILCHFQYRVYKNRRYLVLGWLMSVGQLDEWELGGGGGGETKLLILKIFYVGGCFQFILNPQTGINF